MVPAVMNPIDVAVVERDAASDPGAALLGLTREPDHKVWTPDPAGEGCGETKAFTIPASCSCSLSGTTESCGRFCRRR